MYSEAGPGSPRGAGVGGTLSSDAPGHPDHHSRGKPFRARFAVWAPSPRANAVSWPITARIDYILLKLSQNREVSPKYDEKAYHSPYFQNGPQKSPLGILRFPFLPAFSCKELMGLF